MFHRNRIKYKCAQENTDGKNEECRIGCHFPRRGRRKVHIHGSGDETVEKCHQHTADHSKRDSFHRNLFPARLLDLIGIGIHQNGNRNQENTAEKNPRIPFGRSDVVDDHTENQRQSDSHRKRNRHPRN